MPAITFNTAQKALGHLRSNNGEDKPLLSVKGWEKSKKIYHLKNDLEQAFKAEIDRFRDLIQQRQKLQQEAQKKNADMKELQNDVDSINEEIQELFDVEKEFELSGGLLTEKEFGDVIDSGIFIDLEFAIDTN